MITPRPTHALVRAVPASFARAISAAPPDPPIDVARAQAQQRAYADALAGLGVRVVRVDADEACPDCCFVEDTAVVAADVAVLTRIGAEARRGEVEPVAAALASLPSPPRLVRMPPPATLDGGDCLRLGETVYVGRSARSNDAGIAALREALAPAGIDVVAVAMPPGVLHLKSVCSPLTDDTVLVAEAALPPGTFGRARVVVAPRAEAFAANAVAVGDSALVAAGAPITAERVAASGLRPVPVDTAELRKADGALTCLSILV